MHDTPEYVARRSGSASHPRDVARSVSAASNPNDLARSLSSASAAVEAALGRRQRRDRWTGRALLFVGCVLLVNAVLGERGLVATIRAREDYRRASEGLARLEAENAGLREQARRLQNDPALIELYARRDLYLIKRGEILVQIADVK